jgi:hypothetical protein
MVEKSANHPEAVSAKDQQVAPLKDHQAAPPNHPEAASVASPKDQEAASVDHHLDLSSLNSEETNNLVHQNNQQAALQLLM